MDPDPDQTPTRTTEEKAALQELDELTGSFDPAGSGDQMDRIRRFTSHASPLVRYEARLALDEIHRRFPQLRPKLPADIAGIMDLLDSPDPDVRLQGALGAYQLKAPELLRPLTEVLRNERDPWVRASLVKAVGGFRQNISLPLLMRFLKDPDGRVRANTVEALAVWDNPVVQERISLMLDDPEHRVQAAVLTYLGRGGKSIRRRVEEMLESGHVWMQASAVYVIGNLQPPWALEVLTELLKTGNVPDRRLRARIANWIEVLDRRRQGSQREPTPGTAPETPQGEGPG